MFSFLQNKNYTFVSHTFLQLINKKLCFKPVTELSLNISYTVHVDKWNNAYNPFVVLLAVEAFKSLKFNHTFTVFLML